MTAKRRCPKPTGPEIYTPPSSGPRWKRLEVIWSKSERLGDIPSFRFTIPTIPHIVHPPDDSLEPALVSLIFSLGVDASPALERRFQPPVGMGLRNDDDVAVFHLNVLLKVFPLNKRLVVEQEALGFPTFRPYDSDFFFLSKVS